MGKFQRFQAAFYEPGGDDQDGVLELDSVIAGTSGSSSRATALSAAHLVDPDNGPAIYESWLADGKLSVDPQPSIYLYRTGFRDISGTPVQASAVFGIVLPGATHRDCMIPTVVPVAAPGLSELFTPAGVPLARATDEHGVHHRVWRLEATGVVDTILDAVNGQADLSWARGLVVAYEAGHIEPRPALGMLFAAAPTEQLVEN